MGLVVTIGADCVFTDAAEAALIEPPVIASTIAVMIKPRARAPPPDQVRGRLLTDAARDGPRDADRDGGIDRLSIEQRDWTGGPGTHGITPSHGGAVDDSTTNRTPFPCRRPGTDWRGSVAQSWDRQAARRYNRPPSPRCVSSPRQLLGRPQRHRHPRDGR